jgi:hypothetical protein
VHISVMLSNEGSVPIGKTNGRVLINQVLPLANELMKKAKQGSILDPNQDWVAWPVLSKKDLNLDWTIEPKERDTQEIDFVIPSYVKTIRVRSFIRNPGTKENTWDKISFYDIEAVTERRNP